MGAIVSELLLILIVVLIAVLIWRGPSTLPKLGEAAGKAVSSVRHGFADRPSEQPPDPGEPAETDDRAEPDTRT
jgi:Sec-independent protein translocase protein TatA